MCSEADPCYYDFLVKEEIEKRVFFQLRTLWGGNILDNIVCDFLCNEAEYPVIIGFLVKRKTLKISKFTIDGVPRDAIG